MQSGHCVYPGEVVARGGRWRWLWKGRGSGGGCERVVHANKGSFNWHWQLNTRADDGDDENEGKRSSSTEREAPSPPPRAASPRHHAAARRGDEESSTPTLPATLLTPEILIPARQSSRLPLSKPLTPPPQAPGPRPRGRTVDSRRCELTLLPFASATDSGCAGHGCSDLLGGDSSDDLN